MDLLWERVLALRVGTSFGVYILVLRDVMGNSWNTTNS